MKKLILLSMFAVPIYGAGFEHELAMSLNADNLTVFSVIYETINNPNYKPFPNKKTSLLHIARGPLTTDFLLKKGALVDATDDNGNTPLIKASENGELAVVKLLVEKGAKLTAKNNAGYTAYALAERMHSTWKALGDAAQTAKDNPEALQWAKEGMSKTAAVMDYLKKAESVCPTPAAHPKSQKEQQYKAASQPAIAWNSAKFWEKIQNIMAKYSNQTVPAGKTVWDFWSLEDWEFREKEIDAGNAAVWSKDPELGKFIAEIYMPEYEKATDRPLVTYTVGQIVPALFGYKPITDKRERAEIAALSAELAKIGAPKTSDYLLKKYQAQERAAQPKPSPTAPSVPSRPAKPAAQPEQKEQANWTMRHTRTASEINAGEPEKAAKLIEQYSLNTETKNPEGKGLKDLAAAAQKKYPQKNWSALNVWFGQ